jgi:hypothetical protein
MPVRVRARPKICAICTDHYTRSICEACRRDPANVDWKERSAKEVLGGEDIDEASVGWAHVLDKKFKPYTALEVKILRLLGMATAEEGSRYRRRLGTKLVERPLTMRQIGEICGCSAVFVFKVKRRLSR